MKKILVVGQTPPPYGGQALMTKRLIDAKFDSIEIIHVRLAFSESFLEVGKASWKKVLHVFKIAAKIWGHRLRNRRLVLYYLPAGPNKVPVIRDLLLLSLVRPFFSKTIYHFRAAGISEFISKKSSFVRGLCKLIYGKPTIGIQLSSLNPADAAFFSARNIFHIPNGIEDCKGLSGDSGRLSVIHRNKINILFVGVLREDKGFTWLLDSLNLLVQNKITNFQLSVMGEFSSKEYEQQVKAMITLYNLEDHIVFLGVKIGEEKWEQFANADFLCFPTFFDCESFGNVLIEAMMFELPVISSEWRGIPDIVTNKTGFLVPVRNKEELAEKIQVLILDENLRKQMGRNARERYLEKYTLNHYLNQLESAFQFIR